ncbi:MAG TPA: NAD-dependent epimerase/dehydratase family protein, partial [Candidatus Absconditabacterales bacterium]|nr:NAD-dependent epimerase/dehydratase family protein [Candidatus Absconditabacterales bacterium]
REYLLPFGNNEKFLFHEVDLLQLESIKPIFTGIELVFHLAANSDISKGAQITDIDLSLGTIATYNVLEAMRINEVKKIIFASSSAVYGIAKKIPTAEDDGPMLPISLYGASKLACEGLIGAFCHNYQMQGWIYRFGNVIGRNSTHGAAYDFVKKLRIDPQKLLILGDGKQAKPYIHVDDLIKGMLIGFEKTNEELNYFNLSTQGNTNVTTIAQSIIKHMNLNNVELNYTGGSQGRRGDVPQVQLDPTKIEKLGRKPLYNSEEAVIQGTKEIVQQV